MKFKIRWVETAGYYTEIEANSKTEAIEKFQSGEWDGVSEPDYEVDIQTDFESIEAEPIENE